MRRELVLAVILSATAFACGGSENKPPETPADTPPPAPTAVSDATKTTDAPNARKASTYDKQQTDVSVKRATRQANECAKLHPEGPFGDVSVTLIITSNGDFHDAQLPPPYDGTAIGKCVEQSFEHEKVPPWNGPDEKMDTTVSLKKPAGATNAAATDDGGKKKK